MPKEKAKKPTPLMVRVLRDIAEGRGYYYGCSGGASHGGREKVIWALRKRGYLSVAVSIPAGITEKGLALLDESATVGRAQ